MTEHDGTGGSSVIVDEEAALVDGYRGTAGGNARRMVRIASDRVRFVREWGKWIIYTDGVWLLDINNVLITGVAKKVVQAMFVQAVQPELSSGRDALLAWAKHSEKSSQLSDMINLVRDEDGILIEHTELNQHPELLNVLNGTIDLRTGELLPHDPGHLLTKRLDVEYDPSASSALWDKCLAEWQPNAEVRDYLQEKMGAACTDHVPEEFDIHLGTGGNGKSKFLGQIMHVLGPYAVIPDSSLITLEKNRQHDTKIATLFGARLAAASETTKGVKMNEAMIKKLTGGDELQAHRMREDEWKFTPTASLMLHTNYKPLIMGKDEGIWRRIRLIPWEASFNGDPDLLLADKLREEASGTLNWLVRGTMRWLQRDQRFELPEYIKQVTDAYRAETDPIHTFLASGLVSADPDGHAPVGLVYEVFLAWRNLASHDVKPGMKYKRDFTAYVTTRFGKSSQKKFPATSPHPGNHKAWAGLSVPVYVAEWIADMKAEAGDELPAILDEKRQDSSDAQGAIFASEFGL